MASNNINISYGQQWTVNVLPKVARYQGKTIREMRYSWACDTVHGARSMNVWCVPIKAKYVEPNWIKREMVISMEPWTIPLNTECRNAESKKANEYFEGKMRSGGCKRWRAHGKYSSVLLCNGGRLTSAAEQCAQRIVQNMQCRRCAVPNNILPPFNNQ